MTAQCPLCPKLHDSDEHDPGWYFVCCSVCLVWRERPEGLELEVAPEDWADEGPEPLASVVMREAKQ